MRRTLALISLLIVAGACSLAQPKATVVSWETKVDVDTPNSFTYTHHRVVTVRHQRMKRQLDIFIQMDGNMDLEQFSLVLTDAEGRQLGRVRQKDLEQTEYSEALATDYYYLYKEVSSPVYPVTMTLDYRIRCRANVLSYPSFNPQTDYDMDVKDASYVLTLDNGATCQYASLACNCQPMETFTKKGRRQLTFTMNDLQPVTYESHLSPSDQQLPQVIITPRRFTYYQTTGSMESWQSLGKWNYQLLNGRDILPPQARDKVHQLTDSLSTQREKIIALYELLRNTTRYVSIQLGIGGYQPMTATEVWKTGLGDCKALVNYMQALLHEAGIHSVYTLISTRDKRLLPNMANFQQLNHVVLGVPEQDDTLWIECTNPELPLGYVHDDIAGHDAVCLTEQGGQLVRLPQYADSLHLRETETQLVLSADGAADIRIEDDYYYDRYPAIWHLGKKDIRTQQETINRYYFLPQSELTGMSIDSHLQPFEAPMASIHVKAHSRRYANVTNQRLFVSLNPIRKKGSLDIQDNRQHHFYIGQGYANRERLIVQWPEGFDVEAIPEDVVSEVPFGRFSQHVKKEEGKVIVERYLLIRHGIWQELDMEKATDFLHVIEKQYHARMVLRKKL